MQIDKKTQLYEYDMIVLRNGKMHQQTLLDKLAVVAYSRVFVDSFRWN